MLGLFIVRAFMKLIGIILVIPLLYSTLNWKETIEKKMESIDLHSTLTKQTYKTDSIENVLVQTYKYNKFSKTQVTVNSNYCFTFYKEGGFIFASKTIFRLPVFRKGRAHLNNKDFYLHEMKHYFKKKKTGVKYSREILGNDNTNIDSLAIELQKLKYESTITTKEDYREIHKRYKWLNKLKQ